jgi:hypothetical protein
VKKLTFGLCQSPYNFLRINRRSEMVQSSNATRLMRIQARPGSPVEARHYRYPQRGWVQPDAIARGIPPDASADLVFHGGKTVPQMAGSETKQCRILSSLIGYCEGHLRPILQNSVKGMGSPLA